MTSVSLLSKSLRSEYLSKVNIFEKDLVIVNDECIKEEATTIYIEYLSKEKDTYLSHYISTGKNQKILYMNLKIWGYFFVVNL